MSISELLINIVNDLLGDVGIVQQCKPHLDIAFNEYL